MEHENDGDTSGQWRTRYSHQRIGTGTGELENKKTSGKNFQKSKLIPKITS